MHRFPDSNVAVRRAGPGVDARSWADALKNAEITPHDLLKDAPGGTVFRCTPPGRTRAVVVKVQPLRSLKHRASAATGSSRGHRAWRGAEKLLRAGIAAAEPLLLVDGISSGRRVEALVTDEIRGPSLIEALQSGPLAFADEAERARAIGRQLAQMAAAKLYNRDHKPSNLMLVEDSADPLLIDTVAIRFAPLRVRALKRMLTALAVEPTGLGFPPRRALAMRVVRAAAESDSEARVLYRAVANAIASRTNLVPRDALGGQS